MTDIYNKFESFIWLNGIEEGRVEFIKYNGRLSILIHFEGDRSDYYIEELIKSDELLSELPIIYDFDVIRCDYCKNYLPYCKDTHHSKYIHRDGKIICNECLLL